MRTTIASRLLLAAVILAVTVIVVGLAGAWSVRSLTGGAAELRYAAETAMLSKRLDALVLSVSAESRGIYMSASSQDAEPYAGRLLDNLQSIAGVVARLDAHLRQDELPEFGAVKAELEAFVRDRAELARISRGQGVREARAHGDNDAARAARYRLNTLLDRFTATREARVAETAGAMRRVADHALKVLAWVSGAGLIVGLAASVIVAKRAVIAPVHGMTVAMQALAAEDLSAEIPWSDRRDEIGRMAAALLVFKRNAIAAQDLRAERERERALAALSRRDALRSMAETVEDEAGVTARDIAKLTGDMADAASRLHGLAVRTSACAADSSAAAGEATSSIDIVAAAAQELHASIAEIASRLDGDRTIAHSVVVASQAARDAMSDLSDAMARIGSVVDMISAIANQTRLLSFNATIEATRAGEAGMGFAVVAGEVKGLANQTAKATVQIVGQITAIRAVADAALGAVSGIASTITEVEVNAGVIAAAIEQQSAATAEIARSVGLTAAAAAKVSSLMGDLADQAETWMDLSDDVEKDGARITETVSGLRQTIGRVIRTAAPEVDRRHDSRFGVFLACRCGVGGRDGEAVVTNLSAGGLCLMLAGPAPAVGQRVAVHIADLGDALTLGVAGTGKQFLHLALDDRDRLRGEVVNRVARTGALALLAKARTDHEAFVAGIMAVLDGGSSAKATDLANHHTCRLGKWYDGVSDQRILSCPAYRAMLDPHQRVHDSGKRAVTAHRANDRAAAAAAAADLMEASREVIALLGVLAADVERAQGPANVLGAPAAS